jgi:crotonobetainyl-CoA:carnitine CoA-transferase CaiB-like acyl-CoA transferase
MNTTDFSATSRHRLTNKEDLISENHRSFDIDAKFRDFCGVLELDPSEAGGKITFVGEDPILPCRHRLGACISIPMMAAAVGAATIWRMRSGRGQDLQLDLRKAIHGINPMLKFTPRVNGYPYHIPYALGNPMKFDVYLTKDGRWFCPTGIYPHLLHGWCQFLQCSPESGSIRDAINKWDSAELDEAAAEKNLVFALCLSRDEWLKHPQGQQLAKAPLVEIVKIGDSEPMPFPPAARPLEGVRVLSATHVVAGNVMSRTLAEQGAEVLQLVDPQSFEHESLYIDACVGFQSSWLDLKQPEGRQRALELARRADVFVENFRGRSMSKLGLSPQELAARRPGIIYASGRCYSYDGPWAHRGGFDMEALCSSGFTIEEGTPDRPAFPPTMIMNDYIAGYIGAAGIQAALIRRAKEGGSYHVRVNLTRCAMWFMSLGVLERDAIQAVGEEHQLLKPDTIIANTPYGELVRLAPPVKFSETNGFWEDPVVTVRGSCRPEWKR